MMLQDASSYVRVQNIFNAENFDRTLRPAAEFIARHVNDYKTMPVAEQIAASTGVRLNHIPELNEDHFIQAINVDLQKLVGNLVIIENLIFYFKILFLVRILFRINKI
jgi:hypothetical protein